MTSKHTFKRQRSLQVSASVPVNVMDFCHLLWVRSSYVKVMNTSSSSLSFEMFKERCPLSIADFQGAIRLNPTD